MLVSAPAASGSSTAPPDNGGKCSGHWRTASTGCVHGLLAPSLQIYGFFYELCTKLGAPDAVDLFGAINDSFDWLPLAAIVSDSAGTQPMTAPLRTTRTPGCLAALKWWAGRLGIARPVKPVYLHVFLCACTHVFFLCESWLPLLMASVAVQVQKAYKHPAATWQCTAASAG